MAGRRAKASRRDVSCAPRVAASSDQVCNRGEVGAVGDRRRDRISIVPVMTVRMLLKSWSTPPASWPTIAAL